MVALLVLPISLSAGAKALRLFDSSNIENGLVVVNRNTFLFSSIEGQINALPDDTTGFVCPGDISVYTDLNSCDALITSGLNIPDPDNNIASLSWQMEGATNAQSSSSGINQLSSYVFNEGATVITYLGKTRYNNPINCTFTVTISDNEVPRIIYAPGNITVSNIPGECYARVNWTAPIILDNCVSRENLIVQSNYTSGNDFPVGETEVEYRISDGLNETVHRFKVWVRDTEQPRLIAPQLRAIVCGNEVEDAFTSWNQFEDAGGSVSDNCAVDFSSFRYVSQTASGIRCPYIITRTYSITDESGNIATVNRLIEVTSEETEIEQEEPDRSEPILKSGMGTMAVTVAEGGTANVSCFGDNDGLIIVSVTATNPPYSVNWIGPVSGNVSNQTASSLTISNLTAGNYTIEVTDQDNNPQSINIEITQPAVLNAIVSSSDVSCFGGNDGEIDLTVNGGTPPYSYSWDNGAGTGQDPTNLSANTYSVTVTDDNGCTVNTSATVGQPTQLTASAVPTDVSCFGGNDGEIDLTVNGGTPPYSYSWNNGAGSSEDPTNLSANTYSVTVTDDNGCTANTSATVDQPTQLTASAVPTDVSCFGGNDGEIDLSVNGGTPPYSYSWDNGAGSSEDPTNLLANTYSVTVTDDNGCTANASATVNQPTQLTANATNTDPILCYGETATIQISASGGTSPYTYSFGATSNTNGIFSGISGAIAPGASYNWHVTDANGCTTTVHSMLVIQPPQLTVSASAPDVTCNGQTTTVTITASGGTAPLFYTFNGVTKTNGTFTGITAGTYNWSVTDANNCGPETGTITIGEPDPIAIGIPSFSPILCNGGTTTVTLTAAGGSGNYNFTFNGVTNSSGVFSNVYAGTNLSYSVTDDNGCGPVFESIDIPEPDAISASAAVTLEIQCNGETATVTITASGGTGNLQYTFNGVSQSSNIFTGITPGTNIPWSVTDANNCGPVTGTLTVTQPNALTAAVSETSSITCFGGTADIRIAASGGTGTKTYSFEGQSGNTTGEFTGIPAGTYDWSVVDNNGCFYSGTYEIQEPSAVEITDIGSISDICQGETLTLTSTAQGGTGNRTFSWTGPNGFSSNSPNPSIANATVAATGTYTLTVTDANGCSAQATTDAIVYDTPAVTATSFSQSVCAGNATTAITFSGAASYTWTNDNTSIGLAASGSGDIPSFTPSNDNNTPETATITITPEGNGCTGSPIAVTITVNPIPEVTITNNSTVLCDNGTTSIVLSSNVAGTTFSWSGDDGSSGSGNLIEEVISTTVTYTVTPTANGCTGDSKSTMATVLSDNYNLYTTVTSSTSSAILCSGSQFFIEFDGANPSSEQPSRFWGSVTRWETRFTWSIDNPNVTYNLIEEDMTLSSGISSNDGDDGRLALDIINNTNEDQQVTITVTPWAWTDEGYCVFYSCDYDNDWTQSCSGASFSKTITIRPFEIDCPADIVSNTNVGDCNATLTPDPLIINCDPGTTTTWSTSDGGSGSGNISNYNFSTGTTTVTYRAQQSPSNFRVCTFTVTVTDDEAPVISGCPGNFNVPMDAGECGAVITWSDPTANDNCDGSLVPTRTDGTGLNSGDIFPTGTTTISYSVTDAAGNTGVCSFDIIVAPDNEPPVFTNCPSSPQEVCAPAGSPYTMLGTAWNATATDNCSGTLTKTYTLSGATSGTGTSLDNVEFNVGTTIVTWTATDINGLSSTCMFDVVVTQTPAITADPVSQSVCLNGSVTFTATASGTPAPTYQWYKDGNPLSGETGSTLQIVSTAETDAGSYTVEVSNDCGAAISAPAVLTVSTQPVITTQPASQADCRGNLVEFDVVVGQGNSPYTYYWEMRETSSSSWVEAATVDNIEFNADSSQLRVYNIGNPDNPDQAQYRVTVTDDCGISVSSSVATLTVNQVVSANISVSTVCQGEGTTITAITSGATPLSYQWLFYDGTDWIDLTNGAAYSGATAATLTINNATPAESGQYRFMATFPINKPNNISATECQRTLATTDAVTFTVDAGPDIVATAAPSTICPGGNVEIKIYDANGISGNTYTWTRTNTTTLPGSLTETTINDTLILSGNIGSSAPGTLLTTTFNITGTSPNGCESTGTVDITVVDDEVPVVTAGTCPGDISVGADPGVCGAVVSYTPPTFDDNCDGAGLPGILVSGLASGETFPVGTTTVKYILEDGAENVSDTCFFDVTVTDDVDPSAVCKDITVQLDAAGSATITLADIDNGSSDNCGVPILSLDITSFDCTDMGGNIVTLTATDSVGNTATCTATVTVDDTDYPVDIVVDSIVQTPIDCYGGNATVTIYTENSGTLTYNFGIHSNGTGVFANIPAGNYSWSVTDPQHCGDTISASDFVVVQPGELNANIALTEVTCSSGDDGTITVIGSAGGSGDYEYQLLQNSVVDRTWQSDSVFANLSPGFYDIWMRDANATSCEMEIQSNVEVYIITGDISTGNITCYGGNDGSISITSPAGGTSPYQYSADGGTNWQSSAAFPGLAADTFDVRIRDNDGCVVVLDSMVILTHPDSLDATVASTNVSCGGADDGTITISAASGGTGSYQYSKDGGTTWQPTTTFNALAPGFYDVWIRDGSSCTKLLETVEITELPPLAADLDSSNITCNGGNDGTIIISNATGGSGSYEYSIDNGVSWQANGNYTSLTAGTYQVFMRDSNAVACMLELDANLVLSQPDALVISSEPVDFADCEGVSAQFSVAHSAGVGTVTYTWQKENAGVWNDLANGGDISGANLGILQISNIELADTGLYRVIIEDDCLQDTSTVVSLTVNDIVALTPNVVNSEICEGEDFAFEVLTSGATPSGYQWQVNTSGTWNDISGATTGQYTIIGATPADIGEYRVVVSFPSSAGMCSLYSNAEFERYLNVLPKPTIDSVTFPEYCAGEQTIAITLSGSPSNVVFDISGGTNVGLFLTAADSVAIPQFTTVSGTDTLIITPRANGCYGEPYKLPITVSPTPNIGVSLTRQTICSGTVTDIEFSSFVDSVRYTWSIVSSGANVSGYSESADTLASGLYQVLYNSGTSNETVVYRIYANNKNCPGPTVDVTITVEPDFALVVSNPDPDTVCSPSTIDLTDAAITAGSKAGLDYEWYNRHPEDPGASVIANASNVSVSGTYYVKATDLSSTNYCYKVDSVEVIIAPEPVLALNGDSAIYKCPLDDYDLQNSIDFGASNVSNITYWAPDSTELSNTVVNTLGEYFIVGTNDAGCTDTVLVAVENYSDVETPVFDANSQAHICKGSSSLFYTATAANSTGITYSIEEPSNGNTINPTTGEVTFNPSFSGEVKVIATATGCTANSQGEFIITVHEPPVVTAFNATPTLICEGEPVYLSATVQGATSLEIFSNTSDTDYPILDRRIINSPITLVESTGATISSNDKVFVTVNIEHTYDSDLSIYLVDPSGSYVMDLSIQNGGSGNNYTGTVFSTESSTNITSGSAPFNNTFHPEGSLSDLIGATINGDWELRIRDDYNQDQGTLRDWSLSIEHEDTNGGNFTAVFNEDGTSLGNTLAGTSVTDTIYPLAGTHEYSVTFTDEYGCSATSSAIEVVVQQSPDVEIVADYCVIPGRVQLTAVGGEPGAYYEWTTGDQGTDVSVITVDEVRLYGVTVTNPGGTCNRTVYLKVSDELAINGDFEMGPAGVGTFNTDYTPDNTITGDGYMGEGVYGIGTNARDFYPTFRGAYDHTIGDGTGYFFVIDGTGTNAIVWEQTYSVTPNTNYYFAAWALNIYLDETYGGAMNPHLQFEINGTLFGTDVLLNEWTNDDSNPWLDKFRFYGTWNSGSATTATVRIRNLISGLQRNDFGIDDISFGTLDPLPLTMNLRDTAFCEGGTVRAESNSINGLNPVYTWTHLASGTVYYTDTIPYLELTNITGSDEGYYKLEVDDGYGCEVVPDTFFIEVLDAAIVNAGEDQLYCSVDSTIELSGMFGGSADSAIWMGAGTFMDTTIYDLGGGLFSSVLYHFSDNEINIGEATLVLKAYPDNDVCDPVYDTIVITIQESPIIDSIVVRSPVCNGMSDGSAVVNVSGGTGPGTYSYLWSNGKTSRILTGIGADTLWVEVTDGNGCVVSDTVIITEPDSLIISARSPIVIPPSCYGSNDGMAIIEVTGGIPPYTFEWDEEAALYANKDTAFNLVAGQYTVLVTDSAGCGAQTFPVEVSQPDPPELNCPGDYIDSILPGNCGLVLDTLANPTADGYCDYALYYYLSGDTVVADSGRLTYFEFPVGQTWVKYVIDDGYNRDSCEYLVWIKHADIPEPDISCDSLSPDPVYADASCEAYVTLDPPVYSDPCNEIDSIWNNSPYGTATDASGTYPVDTTEFKWFVQDKSGNMDSSCVVQVIVLDTMNPYITCPGDAIDTAAANNCSKVSGELADPVWGDDCSNATLSWKMEGATSGQGDGTVSDSAFYVGLTKVTYFVKDNAGNKDSCSFTVRIVDITDPYISVGCESVRDTASANFCSKVSGRLKDPELKDNCWDTDSLTLSWTMSGATTGSGSGSVKDSTFNVGLTTVIYTVSDPDGNSGECTFTVTIVDVIDPEIKVGCANVTDTLASDECSKISAEIDDPILEDNCWSTDSLSLRWIMSGATTGSGVGSVADSSFSVGVTTVTYIVTDPDNNSDSCTFTVTILHLNIPTANFTCPQDTVRVVPNAGDCEADVTLGALTYTDPCNEIDSVWNNSPYRTSPADASGTTYPVDTTTFNWYITDISGNIDSCTVTVIVEDLPPTITCPPDVDTTADYGEMFNSNVLLQDPAYGDNCPDPELSWRLIPPTGYESEYNSSELSGAGVYVSPDTFWVGVTTIWYKVVDSQGNADSCSFTVTIEAAPEIECPPSDTFYVDNSGCTFPFDPGIPSVVSGVPPFDWTWTMEGVNTGNGSTNDADLPDPIGTVDFNLGLTTITWTAENLSGADTCNHHILVIDTIPPTLTADPYENCVDPLHWAVYNEANPNPVYNHVDPLVEKFPVDYRTLFAGDEFLDLTSLEDNCCDSTEMTIHWRIEFSDTPDPVTGAAVSHSDITGTAQPSEYEVGGIPTDIYLWGDGVTFTAVTHQIYYWVEDCNGNTSEEIRAEITITPRPKVKKEGY